MGDRPENIEKPSPSDAVDKPLIHSVTDIKPGTYWEKAGAETFKSFSENLVEQGIMPPLDRSDLMGTMASAAEAQVGKTVSIPGDRGAASGSLASMVAKFGNGDIELNANIRDLVNDLTGRHNWQIADYKSGDDAPPGSFLVSDFDRPVGHRNIGIVDSTGKNAIFDQLNGGIVKAKIERSSPQFKYVLTPPKDS